MDFEHRIPMLHPQSTVFSHSNRRHQRVFLKQGTKNEKLKHRAQQERQIQVRAVSDPKVELGNIPGQIQNSKQTPFQITRNQETLLYRKRVQF